jgi:N6-adenosine-specific RNA methylase IME4
MIRPDQWIFDPLPRRSFGLILADPPWNFKTYSDAGQGKSPSQHYGCMDHDALKALPVADLAAPHCALVMWTVWAHLQQAIELGEHWGFKFKSGGVWAKQAKTDHTKWAFSTGYYFRGASEPFLLFTIGKPRVSDRSIRNLIVGPVREHSRKPDDMHVSLEAMFPEMRKAELFARQRRDGWGGWGNEYPAAP